jgi:hypothetical protein
MALNDSRYPGIFDFEIGVLSNLLQSGKRQKEESNLGRYNVLIPAVETGRAGWQEHLM